MPKQFCSSVINNEGQYKILGQIKILLMYISLTSIIFYFSFDRPGAFIITICGMKLLRSCFTNTPRQHIILIWTVLFFEYDFRGCSETFLIDYFFMSIFVDKVNIYSSFSFFLKSIDVEDTIR